jgi:predicted HicB family RNase H-like nuclease
VKNTLEYKGYYTHIEYSAEDQVLHGKIEGIQDLVNFECERADEAPAAFHQAVDDYLAYCEDLGVQPEKAYRGVFNVRFSPALHRSAALEAAREGITLNQFVSDAVEKRLRAI